MHDLEDLDLEGVSNRNMTHEEAMEEMERMIQAIPFESRIKRLTIDAPQEGLPDLNAAERVDLANERRRRNDPEMAKSVSRAVQAELDDNLELEHTDARMTLSSYDKDVTKAIENIEWWMGELRRSWTALRCNINEIVDRSIDEECVSLMRKSGKIFTVGLGESEGRSDE